MTYKKQTYRSKNGHKMLQKHFNQLKHLGFRVC